MFWFKRSQKSLDDALLAAAGRHNVDKVKKLIADGANIHAVDEAGNTALHKIADYCPFEKYASHHLKTKPQLTELFSLLKNMELDVKARNKKGETPAHVTTWTKVRHDERAIGEMLNMLNRHGVDMRAVDEKGRTGLHIVAQLGRTRLKEEFDDSLNSVKDNDGRYPYQTAMNSGYHTFSQELRYQTDKYLRMEAEDAKKAEAAAEDALIRKMLIAKPKPPKPVPPPPAPPPTPKVDSEWKLLDKNEAMIARVTQMKDIGYRITEIFNFRTRIYTKVLQNAKSSADTPLADRPFDDYPDKTLFEDARLQLAKMGVEVDTSVVQANILKKSAPKSE